MLLFAICDSNARARSRLRNLIELIPDAQCAEYESLASLEHSGKAVAHTFVIATIENEQECELIRVMKEGAPLTRWVGVLNYHNPKLAQQAVLMGCGLIVVKPVDQDTLGIIAYWFSNGPAGGLNPSGVAQGEGHIIGVWSPLGGVGKTSIALNLAAGIADGARTPVCLTEASSGPSGLARWIGQHSFVSMADLADIDSPLTLDRLRHLVLRTNYNVGVLTASSALKPLLVAESTWVSRACERLRECPLITVVDIPSGWNESVARTLQECSAIVLIGPQDKAAIEEMAAAWNGVKTMLPTTPTIHLVLNGLMAESRWNESALRTRFAADTMTVFPRDPKLLETMAELHRPLLKHDKKSRWRNARDQLAEYVQLDLVS